MDWRLLAVVYAVVVAVLVVKAWQATRTGPLFLDTDDAMRLVDVHDFLAGQGWYDHIQHRLNTPYGGEIHWSRLIDVSEAALLALLRTVAGPGVADRVLGYLWPLMLLGVLLYLCGRLTLRLVGREGLLAGLALPALAPLVMAEFTPGRLDHHSVQILICLLATLLAIEAVKRPLFAIGAGIAAMTGLAIGAECLPIVAAIIAAFTLMWVVQPARADAMRGFGISFGLAGMVHLAIALPPARWLEPACDALSIVYVAAGAGTGAVLVFISLLPLGSAWWQRLLAAGLGGLALVSALALAFPDCLAGPYAAVDPWLVTHWLSRIDEARSLWTADNPAIAVGAVMPMLAALVAIAARVFRRQENRIEWLVLVLVLVLALAVTILQLRGARLALCFTVPAGAWVIVEARARYLNSRRLRDAAALVAGWLAFAGLASSFAVALAQMPFQTAEAGESGVQANSSCLTPEAFAGLAALPTARVMAPIDLGPHILLNTDDEVVAGPYHRVQQGLLDTFAFFNQPLTVARSILAERGIDLVVICPTMAEVGGLRDKAPDSFAARFAEGRLPNWLTDITPAGSTLRIYAVRR